MYSTVCRQQAAHEDSIWACAWGKASERHVGDKEEEEDGTKSPQEKVLSSYIITGSVDDKVKVWEYCKDTLKLVHTLKGHSLGIISLAVNSKGDVCASSSLDSSIKLWDLETGANIGSVTSGPVDVWTIAFSPDDKFIISGSNAGKINIYGVESLKKEQTLDTRGKFTLSIAYSPDGKYIASGAIDGIINIFDNSSGKLVHTLEGHAMPIRSLCFSPNSKYLLTGSDDAHMKLYAVHHAQVVSTLSGHGSWVLSVAFSPNEEHFVSGSSDHTVKLWSLNKKESIQTYSEHNDEVWGVKFSPDGTRILSVSEDKNIHIYNCPC